VAISSPATNVHTGFPNSSWAITAVKSTTSVPASADVNLHPHGSIPKALMPSAISHLPSGGWTHEPTSHFCWRQYFSSFDSMRHVSSDQPTRMHAALG
jgi:hypothetical protein